MDAAAQYCVRGIGERALDSSTARHHRRLADCGCFPRRWFVTAALSNRIVLDSTVPSAGCDWPLHYDVADVDGDARQLSAAQTPSIRHSAGTSTDCNNHITR